MGRMAAIAGPERRIRADGSRGDRSYSWLEDYLATLDGKEAREEYYARLEYDEFPRGTVVGDPDRSRLL